MIKYPLRMPEHQKLAFKRAVLHGLCLYSRSGEWVGLDWRYRWHLARYYMWVGYLTARRNWNFQKQDDEVMDEIRRIYYKYHVSDDQPLLKDGIFTGLS